jgi:hypothetical protein
VRPSDRAWMRVQTSYSRRRLATSGWFQRDAGGRRSSARS